MALISKLPLFPLGVVLYPGERLPLHIFEPRYIEMVRYCLEGDRRFGMIYLAEGKLSGVGCIAQIQRITQQYDDGRMDLTVMGAGRFKVVTLYQEKAYVTADVDVLAEAEGISNRELKERAITQHMRLLELAGRTLRPTIYQGKRDVSYFLAHNSGLTDSQKQALLELDSEDERIAYLVRHFEGIIPKVESMETFRKKVQSNGHIRDFPLGDDA